MYLFRTILHDSHDHYFSVKLQIKYINYHKIYNRFRILTWLGYNNSYMPAFEIYNKKWITHITENENNLSNQIKSNQIVSFAFKSNCAHTHIYKSRHWPWYLDKAGNIYKTTNFLSDTKTQLNSLLSINFIFSSDFDIHDREGKYELKRTKNDGINLAIIII